MGGGGERGSGLKGKKIEAGIIGSSGCYRSHGSPGAQVSPRAARKRFSEAQQFERPVAHWGARARAVG